MENRKKYPYGVITAIRSTDTLKRGYIHNIKEEEEEEEEEEEQQQQQVQATKASHNDSGINNCHSRYV